ncbi:SgcJ/EcaC family oxidoreductase [Mycobacterium yunnanensis]|uniref:SgcJ/EcaC family oxidoreductase n=1 Tax=Mycobacterium yunnanensis TaxID=368477 RepID=A0A9X2YWY6_9MYCO|nr:nuclear transport factor 2 family protein [Mycobacterium yunnanensis]MCV7419340.1 SgcJ/EcaC family oxidoreductase [Mycobacterium yunnanensis]
MSPEAEIRALLDTYERALNTDDTALAVSCYTADGVFMPTTLPTAAGPDLTRAYEQIFAAIHLDVTFTVDELVVASDVVAYALTRSAGQQTVHATGERSAESNREMFVFTADDGPWKIARYIFNKPN